MENLQIITPADVINLLNNYGFYIISDVEEQIIKIVDNAETPEQIAKEVSKLAYFAIDDKEIIEEIISDKFN